MESDLNTTQNFPKFKMEIMNDECKIEAMINNSQNINNVQLENPNSNPLNDSSNIMESGSFNLSKTNTNLSFQTMRVSKNTLSGSLVFNSINFPKEHISEKNISDFEPSLILNRLSKNDLGIMESVSIIEPRSARSQGKSSEKSLSNIRRKDSHSIEDEQNNITQNSVIYRNKEQKSKMLDLSINHTPSICNYYQPSNEVTPNKPNFNFGESTRAIKMHVKNLNIIFNNNGSPQRIDNSTLTENENCHSSRNNLLSFLDKKTPLRYNKSQLRSGEKEKVNSSEINTSLVKVNQSFSSRETPSPFDKIYRMDSKPINCRISQITREVNMTLNKSPNEENHDKVLDDSDLPSFNPILNRKNLNEAFNQIKEINNKESKDYSIENTGCNGILNTIHNISNEHLVTDQVNKENFISIKAPIKNENFSFDITNTHHFIINNSNPSKDQKESRNEELLNKISKNIYPNSNSAAQFKSICNQVTEKDSENKKTVSSVMETCENEHKPIHVRKFPSFVKTNSIVSLKNIPQSSSTTELSYIKTKSNEEYYHFIRRQTKDSENGYSINFTCPTERNNHSTSRKSPMVKSEKKFLGSTLTTSDKTKVSNSKKKNGVFSNIYNTHFDLKLKDIKDIPEFNDKKVTKVSKSKEKKVEVANNFNKLNIHKVIIKDKDQNTINNLIRTPSYDDRKRESSFSSKQPRKRHVELFKTFNKEISPSRATVNPSPLFDKKKTKSNIPSYYHTEKNTQVKKARTKSRGSLNKTLDGNIYTTLEPKLTTKKSEKIISKIKRKSLNKSNVSSNNNTIVNTKEKDVSPIAKTKKSTKSSLSPLPNIKELVFIKTPTNENKDRNDSKQKKIEIKIKEKIESIKNKKEETSKYANYPNYSANTTVSKVNSKGKEILKRLEETTNNISLINKSNISVLNTQTNRVNTTSSFVESKRMGENSKPKIISNFDCYTKKKQSSKIENTKFVAVGTKKSMINNANLITINNTKNKICQNIKQEINTQERKILSYIKKPEKPQKVNTNQGDDDVVEIDD